VHLRFFSWIFIHRRILTDASQIVQLECHFVRKSCSRVAVGLVVGVVLDIYRQRNYRYVVVYISLGVVPTEQYRLTLYLLSLFLFSLHLCYCGIIVYSKKVVFFYFAPHITLPSHSHGSFASVFCMLYCSWNYTIPTLESKYIWSTLDMDWADGFWWHYHPLLTGRVRVKSEQNIIAQGSQISCVIWTIHNCVPISHPPFPRLNHARCWLICLDLFEETDIDALHTLGVHPIYNQFYQYCLSYTYWLWQSDKFHQLLQS